MKKSWFYWMYKYAKKTGYGSFIPDFDQGLLTKTEFDKTIRGQTIHELSKKELNELKKLASITDTNKIPYFREERKMLKRRKK